MFPLCLQSSLDSLSVTQEPPPGASRWWLDGADNLFPSSKTLQSVPLLTYGLSLAFNPLVRTDMPCLRLDTGDFLFFWRVFAETVLSQGPEGGVA